MLGSFGEDQRAPPLLQNPADVAKDQLVASFVGLERGINLLDAGLAAALRQPEGGGSRNDDMGERPRRRREALCGTSPGDWGNGRFQKGGSAEG